MMMVVMIEWGSWMEGNSRWWWWWKVGGAYCMAGGGSIWGGVSLLAVHVSVALVWTNLDQHKKQYANQPWWSWRGVILIERSSKWSNICILTGAAYNIQSFNHKMCGLHDKCLKVKGPCIKWSFASVEPPVVPGHGPRVFLLKSFSISSSSKGSGGCVCGPAMLLIYCLEIPIGRSAFRELRDRCKKAAANPDNEDGQLCWEGNCTSVQFQTVNVQESTDCTNYFIQDSTKTDNEDGQACW